MLKIGVNSKLKDNVGSIRIIGQVETTVKISCRTYPIWFMSNIGRRITKLIAKCIAIQITLGTDGGICPENCNFIWRLVAKIWNMLNERHDWLDWSKCCTFHHNSLSNIFTEIHKNLSLMGWEVVDSFKLRKESCTAEGVDGR